MKNLLLSTFILIILGFTSCEKKCKNVYRFQVPFTLSPQIDTFHIGDTIWVSCNFPKEVLELNSNEYFDLENFDLRSELTLADIGVEPFEDANLTFTVIEEKGSLELTQFVGTTTYSINYLYENDKFKTQFGLIPQNEGFFYFGMLSPFKKDVNNYGITPDCDESIENIDYLLNGGQNNNYEFIQLSADASIRSTTKEIFDMYGHYCFYVVE